MTRYLITGGAGFIGSNLAVHLKQQQSNAEVVAFDNLHRRGSELTLPRLRAHGVRFCHGDIRMASDLAALPRPDWVIECSAEPSVLAGRSADSGFVVDTNLGGAVTIARFCQQHEAGLLFLSTSRVYPFDQLRGLRYDATPSRFSLAAEQSLPGAGPYGVSESFPLHGPRSIYGATKYAAEIMLAEFRHAFSMPVIVNRCGVVAGPWQFGRVDQGVAALWTMAHLRQQPLRYIGFGGRGLQVRDLLHVSDLCRLISIQLTRPEAFQDQAFNVGGGLERSISLKELTELCQRETGLTTEVTSEPETRYADVPIYVTDARGVQARSGWQPEHTVGDIVRDLCLWLQHHPEVLNLQA